MKYKTYYLVLVLLNLIGIFFVLQIELNLFELFKSNYEDKVANAINDLVVNISLGLIVSSLFYLIIVYYPGRLKRKSAYKIIQPRLNTIGNQLHHSINYLYSKRIDVGHRSMEELTAEDFDSIISINGQRMDFQHNILGDHGDWIPFSSGEQTEINFFSHQRGLIISKIDEMFAIPTIAYIDAELIEALAKLRDSWFYSGVESFSRNGERVRVMNFNKGVYDYYKFYLKIKEYAKINELKVVN